MVTLKDIAREAQVSVMTVSNVVNGNLSKVSPQKAAEIRRILDARNYIQNASARSLAKANSNIVAIMLRSIGNENSLSSPHNAVLVGKIIQRVQVLGYYAMVNMVESKEDIARNLRTWNALGSIFLGMFDDEIEQIYAIAKIPMVFIDSYSNVRRICSIGIDDYKGGQIVAKHLLQNGHRRVAFVSPPNIDNGVIQHRWSGFASEMARSGVGSEAIRRFVLESDNDPVAVAETAAQLYAQRHEITAIFASSDQLAACLMAGLFERGVRVPEELSVVGFDNLSIGRQIYPALTTVAQDLNQKAELAVEILQRQLNSPAAPAEARVLDVHLIERGTVRRLDG